MGRCINRCIVSLLPSRAAHFNICQLLLCIIMHICQTPSTVHENTPTELKAMSCLAALLPALPETLLQVAVPPSHTLPLSSEIWYSSARKVRSSGDQHCPCCKSPEIPSSPKFEALSSLESPPSQGSRLLPGKSEVRWGKLSSQIEPLQP